MASLERTRLLIIDDWGPEPLTADQRRDLLEIVDDRYDRGSLLITSRVPVSRWHEVIGDPTIGDAILILQLRMQYFARVMMRSCRGGLMTPSPPGPGQDEGWPDNWREEQPSDQGADLWHAWRPGLWSAYAARAGGLLSFGLLPAARRS
jgi:hypothetical protein